MDDLEKFRRDVPELAFATNFKFNKFRAPIRSGKSPPKQMVRIPSRRASYGANKQPPEDAYTRKLRRHLEGINKRLELYDSRLPRARPATVGVMAGGGSSADASGMFSDAPPPAPGTAAAGYHRGAVTHRSAGHSPRIHTTASHGALTARSSGLSVAPPDGPRAYTAAPGPRTRDLGFMREVRERAQGWVAEREREQREALKDVGTRLLQKELQGMKDQYPSKLRRSTHKSLQALAQRNVQRRLGIEVERRKLENGWTQDDGRVSAKVMSRVAGEYKRQLRREEEEMGWDGGPSGDMLLLHEPGGGGHHVHYDSSLDHLGPPSLNRVRSQKSGGADSARRRGETLDTSGTPRGGGGAEGSLGDFGGEDRAGGSLEDDAGGPVDPGAPGGGGGHGGGYHGHDHPGHHHHHHHHGHHGHPRITPREWAADNFPPSPPPNAPGTLPPETPTRARSEELSHVALKHLREGSDLPDDEELRELSGLYLAGAGIGNSGVKELTSMLGHFTHLKVLDVSGNDIGAAACASLFDALYRCHSMPLEHLDLSSNAIGGGGAGGAAAVSAFLDSERKKGRSRIRTLVLRANRLGNSGARTVANSLKKNQSVTYLDLAENAMGKTGAKALGDMLMVNTTLKTLDLSWNDIGQEGIAVFAERLVVNEALSSLDLSWNVLGYGGGCSMAMAIANNRGLENLNLSSCRLDDDSVMALASALMSNGQLRTLNVDNNPVGDRAGKKMMRAVYMVGRLQGFGRHGTNTEGVVGVRRVGEGEEGVRSRRLPSMLAMPRPVPEQLLPRSSIGSAGGSSGRGGLASGGGPRPPASPARSTRSIQSRGGLASRGSEGSRREL